MILKPMTKTPNDTINKSKVDQWFEKIIGDLKTDHFLLDSDIASAEKKAMYDIFINENEMELASLARKTSSMFFIRAILLEYLSILKTAAKQPLKLAFALSDSKLLVWSEIEDEDEEMEDALLIAEAKVNGKYFEKGFYITSSIVEKSDNFPIPNHYQTIQ
jgi:hypothetical protein